MHMFFKCKIWMLDLDATQSNDRIFKMTKYYFFKKLLKSFFICFVLSASVVIKA